MYKMKIKTFSLFSYAIPLTNGQLRNGVLINITDEKGNSGCGDVAPLPKWSQETLEDSLAQLNQKQQEILEIDWTIHSYPKEIKKLKLFPSVLFGLESALLSILSPIPEHIVSVSALLMGSPQEIIEQARLKYHQGWTSAKLKVGHLSFKEAAEIIHQLKNKFRLRVDVNRAWNTCDSLQFFKQFPLDTFDYVEEPFQNPNDLSLFPHPLAVDESFPHDLSLEKFESLPTLRALIYKPTIQGGMLGCLPLHEWTLKKGIKLVLSSSFESDIGLAHIASIAYRLSLSAPIGIGTYDFLNHFIRTSPLRFSRSFVHIPGQFLCK